MEIPCSCKNQDCPIESIYISDGMVTITFRFGGSAFALAGRQAAMYLDANGLVELVRQGRASLMEMAK